MYPNNVMISVPQGDWYPPKLSNSNLLTRAVAVKTCFLSYDVSVVFHRKQMITKERRSLLMKKFIALGVALVVVLFSFLPTATVAKENYGVSVCEDLEPNPNPHD